MDLQRRYAEHCQGSPKCKYTRSFPPIKIAASWEFDCDLSTILKLEHWVKKLTRPAKIKLIGNPDTLHTELKVRPDVVSGGKL